MGILISCFKINPRNRVKVRKNVVLNRKNSKTLTVDDELNYLIGDVSNMITGAYQQALDNELYSIKVSTLKYKYSRK